MTWAILPHISETSNSGRSQQSISSGRIEPLKRALTLVRPHAGTFILGLFALTVGSAITVALPEVGRRLLESPFRSSILENPVPLALILGGVFAIQSLCLYLRTLAFGTVGAKVVRSSRTAFFEKALAEGRLDDGEGSGVLASRIDSDATFLSDAVAAKLPLFVRYGFQSIASLAFMVFLSPSLSLVAAVSVAFLILTASALMERLRRSARDEQTSKAIAVGWTREVFESIPTVRALDAGSFVRNSFAARLQSLFIKGQRRLQVGAMSSAVLVFINSASIVVGVSYGISLVSAGHISWSELATFAVYATILTISCALCIGGFVELLQCMGAAERLIDNSESVSASNEVKNGVLSRLENGGIAIACNAVGFDYSNVSSEPVLNALSLTIASGSIVGIMGPSGAGKSTLVKLLLGFEQPTSGSILLDGMNHFEIAEQSLREKVAWVPHEPALLSVSIAENLRLANPRATDDQLMTALEKVGLARLVRQCPEGLATEIGERGGGLSSGQRQRLALARLFLRDPALIILDEATAALDVDTEQKVQASLREAFPHATFLIISHRVSSVRMAHRVFAMQGGQIFEEKPLERISGGTEVENFSTAAAV